MSVTVKYFFPSQDKVPGEADVHSEICDTARKIAEMESNYDENEDIEAETHTDNVHPVVDSMEKREMVSQIYSCYTCKRCIIYSETLTAAMQCS